MERQRGKVVPENCALLGYYAAVLTRCVITQKNAVSSYFAAVA